MIKFHYFLKKKYNADIGFEQAVQLNQEKHSSKKKNRLISKKQTPLDIGFRIGGKYFKVRTQERVYPDKWDQKAQEVKSGAEASILNDNLDRLMKKVRKGFLQLEHDQMDGQPITADQIKSMIKNIIEMKKPVAKTKDFFIAFETFLKEKQPFFKKNNVKKYGTLKGHLLRYQNETSPIRFESIDDHFLERLTAFLITNGKHARKKDGKQPTDWQLKNNSIAKILANLKAFLRWAIANDYMTNTKVLNYKIKYDATNIVCFTKEEFQKLYELDLSTDRTLAAVRDSWCFQALTGQRWSDCASLHWNNIIRKNGDLVWGCYQHKGNRSAVVEIPLSNRAIKILEKYPRKFPEGTTDIHGNIIQEQVLPIKSEQVMNRHLKTLAQMVGLNDIVEHVKFSGAQRIPESKPRWQLISTHTARRTFVTLSLEMGMRPEVVASVTGHTSLKQLMRYTKITDKVKSQELKNAWNFPN